MSQFEKVITASEERVIEHRHAQLSTAFALSLLWVAIITIYGPTVYGLFQGNERVFFGLLTIAALTLGYIWSRAVRSSK